MPNLHSLQPAFREKLLETSTILCFVTIAVFLGVMLGDAVEVAIMSRIARAGCVGSRTSSFLPRPHDSGNGASGQNFRRFSALAALALRSVRPATENRSFKNHGNSGEEFGDRPPAGCRCMARQGAAR